MAIFCYRNDRGEAGTREYPLRQTPPQTIRINGAIAHRDYQAEHVRGTVRGSDTPIRTGRAGGWPMEPCVASGVNADQADELRKHLKEKGVPTEVTKDGDPIYRTPKHRREALKARGLHDRNSFN